MMAAFTCLHAVAAPLDRINVDTDAILPARFMKTVKRTGLGAHLFDAWRYRPDGGERPDFVLNQPAFRTTQILVTNENFGCGSSREHAVWALADFGIRCIIAPSFAEIFYNNSLKNGLLPVVLAQHEAKGLRSFLEQHPGTALTVNLETQSVIAHDGSVYRFDIEPFAKHRLLSGLDEIATTLEQESAIARYELKQRELTPWLFKDI